MNNLEEKASQLLKELDITKLKDESKRTKYIVTTITPKINAYIYGGYSGTSEAETDRCK